MRSTSFAILAAATAAAAQTTEISFFYPSANELSYYDYYDIALSVIEVQDADHTVVEFGCASTTTTTSSSSSSSSSAAPTSTDDDYYYYGDSCVFAGGALTATVGPDSFAYTTVVSDNYGYGSDDSYSSYDFTMTMGCTSVDELAYCTYQSAGKDVWSDYCSYSLDYSSDADVSSCVSAHATSVLPASTSALQADEVGTITMTVTAGADKISAGAAASATGASSTRRTKFTVSQTATAVAGGATTTIGGPLGASGSTSASGSAASGSASSTASAAAAMGGAVRNGAAVVGVVGGIVAALAL
ncbi:hypothetical protein GTA08_BOTSDO00984 [Botryosphaeria dothidea]|uniref:Uncharacterized protein n=1 Tax=Botryosphaeria dothidea TaxID=55169 RepID=A0A8H4N6U4_9PEZI|nr:hypothetical protein GTA08_BOTSDO00984 [Botryosphaeria dothidea]